MNEEIVVLAEDDFDESLAVKNKAFGKQPPGFATLLPLLYRPEAGGLEFAIRRDGRICALIGIFEMTWHLSGQRLRVGGIGGVATLPEFRGQGLMRRLMHHCLTVMRDDGIDLSWLGGQRQRYSYFGYERCGGNYTFTISATNLRHGGAGSAALAVHPLDADLVPFAQSLNESLVHHVPRSVEDFDRRCRSWHNRPYVVIAAGDPIGYLIATPDAGAIVELVPGPGVDAADLVRAWIESGPEGDHPGQRSVRVDVDPADAETVRSLETISEGSSVTASGNWQIFRWARVLDVLLRARGRLGAMAPGRLILDAGAPANLELPVDASGAGCAETTAAADYACNPLLATRLLFGPLTPAAVASLPPAAGALLSWSPLPLGWRRQDGG